jgi:hypothetical protein
MENKKKAHVNPKSAISNQRLQNAGIAQLVELHPSKVVVVSSSLIARFYHAHVAQ